MTETTAIASRSLADQIRKWAETGQISIPPLPGLVTRLTALLKDDSQASAKRVAELIRNDPAIAATLLRWANSAAFGGLDPITDLSLAVARLGLNQVASAVTTLAHSAHFSSSDPWLNSLLKVLWGHAVATAQAAKHLAGLVGADPEESFIAGLLHDTGRLLVLEGVDLLENRTKPVHVTPALLDELMEALHTELGYTILSSWHLPEAICEAALHHHDDDLTLDSPLVIRVQAADAIARKIGEHPSPEPDLDLLNLPPVGLLNLADIELASLMVDIEDEIAQIRSLI